MKCPECGKDMKRKYDSGYYRPFTTGDEPDYPDYYERETFACGNCHIKCINGEWNIPKPKQASNKQIKCINSICSILRIDEPPLTKRSACSFINKYMEESKKAAEANQYFRCLEMMEMGCLPDEEFF